MKKSIKKEALLIILVFAALILLFAISRTAVQKNGKTVVITLDGVLYGRYPLSVDSDIPITKDNNVINRAVIENGTVYMADASCRNHICVSMGRKKASGESIVCLPNRVVIRIEGESEGDDYDVITD